MKPEYDVLIMTTAQDFLRLKNNYHRLIKNMPARRLIFVGNAEVGDLVQQLSPAERVSFINEDEILPFASVNAIMQDVLQREDIPRGVTGWYYQQFLKMRYSLICKDDYYLVWDGDTIPCKPFTMFSEDGVTPFFDLKREYHEEYFVTIGKLFPGMHKCIEPSFISEHMIIRCDIMRNLIADIMKNEKLNGESFYERIIRCIDAEKLISNSFSEFETYGTYVCFKYLGSYRLRNWHSFRYAGYFFHPDTITDADYEWLGKDFEALSFERGHTVREDHRDIFTKAEYREKLSARQILEIAQQEFEEGYLEVWEDSLKQTDADKEALVYEKLGDDYLEKNINQAFLCYENAEFLCSSNELQKRLRGKKEELLDTGGVTVNKVSIVIVSYNSQYLMEQCLASIRKNCNPQTYQIVVVDNASTDGVREWLQEQKGIKLVLSEENLGFPKGCNAGIEASDDRNDIFLLNNDTRMAPNALFWLRMGLYENAQVGAAGCVANYCGNDQQIEVVFKLPNEYLEYGKTLNVYCENPYEERNRLCGFAMLIRRQVLDSVGELDENFTPGFFEDDDLSVRIKDAGYRLMICHNSFIYHAGSQSFSKKSDVNDILNRNHMYFMNKWKFDITTNSLLNTEAMETLSRRHTGSEKIAVLELGAGCGNTLGSLRYLFPQAELYGIEEDALAVKYAVQNVEITAGDWKTMELPFAEHFFDYVIYSNRWGQPVDEELLISRLEKYVKEDGMLII